MLPLLGDQQCLKQQIKTTLISTQVIKVIQGVERILHLKRTGTILTNTRKLLHILNQTKTIQIHLLIDKQTHNTNKISLNPNFDRCS